MYPNYPNQGGYPNQANPPFGFNQNPGYPNPGYPQQPGLGFDVHSGTSGYPNQNQQVYPGFQPSQQGAFPPNQSGSSGFPIYPGGPQQGYPQQPGYPSQPSYPQNPSGFPANPSYPQNTSGFPTNPSYPSQPGFSHQHPAPPPPNPGYLPDHIASNPNFQPSQYPGASNPAYPQNQFNPAQPNPSNIFPNLHSGHQGGGQAFPGQVPQPMQPRYNPTLRPYQPFNPNDDAAKLYKAMKGFGTDETVLIDILCRRTSDQRQQIALQYKSGYGKDLLKNIKDETRGNFELVFKALLYTPFQLEAHDLKKSIENVGTDEEALIDVICTKNSQEMIQLKNAYRQMYSRNIEEDVRSDASGYFKRFLVSLMTANRPETPADYQRAAQQARALYEAGEKRMGTNEVEFNRIFASESFAQLRAVFEEYYKLTGHDIDKAIRKEMSGDVERAFLAIAQIARNPALYYANRLHETMAGAGTKDRSLIRLLVLRSEIDLMDVKMEYQRKFGKSLESAIKSDCSGDYKRALLCLAGDPNWR